MNAPARWCSSAVYSEQYGAGHRAEVSTHDRNYGSVVQDGYDGSVTATMDGGCNATVIGRLGDDNDVASEFSCARNGVGGDQSADGAKLAARLHGRDNKAAVEQYRNGARASSDVDGQDNKVVSRQN